MIKFFKRICHSNKAVSAILLLWRLMFILYFLDIDPQSRIPCHWTCICCSCTCLGNIIFNLWCLPSDVCSVENAWGSQCEYLKSFHFIILKGLQKQNLYPLIPSGVVRAVLIYIFFRLLSEAPISCCSSWICETDWAHGCYSTISLMVCSQVFCHLLLPPAVLSLDIHATCP